MCKCQMVYLHIYIKTVSLQSIEGKYPQDIEQNKTPE